MSDLRLHIASLAAVFLALGLGILVGTAFVGTPVVERQGQAMVRQQKALVQRLDDLSGALRRESDEGKKNEAAVRVLLPRLVAGKLAGRRVLIVRAGDYADAVERAAEALEMAGAVVSRVDLPEEAWRARLAPTGGAGTRIASERIAEEAGALAPLLLGGGDGLNAYREDRRVVGDLPEEGGGVRLVVVVGGKKASPDAAVAPSAETPLLQELGAALVRAWRQASPEVMVVGAEPLQSDLSFVPVWQAEGIATVDNVDRAAGQIALPFALAGEKAAYGMKPTADLVLPPSLQEPPRPDAGVPDAGVSGAPTPLGTP